MLRVARKRIRRGSLTEYDLLRREDGSPSRGPPDSSDMLPDTGFCREKFTRRLGADSENGLIGNALGNFLSLSSSTDGGGGGEGDGARCVV